MKHLAHSILITAVLICTLVLSSCQREDINAPLVTGDHGNSLGKQVPTGVPLTIAVPEGNKLQFAANAEGVQIYQVQLTGSGYAWVFIAPEATLYEGNNGVVGKHYAGPTWETNSGSFVKGAKIASAPSPNANSIPQLLLRATTSGGPGVLDGVTYIQRLNTSGGIAPATGADAGHVGEYARVPYTAEYYFYTEQD